MIKLKTLTSDTDQDGASPTGSSASKPQVNDSEALVDPTVSIVICNTSIPARKIDHLIESLRHQTYGMFEVVLVQAGAGPDPRDHVDPLPNVREVWVAGANASIAKNAGIDAAAGDLVAFIDPDAVADPHWLEELVRYVSRPNLVGAGGRFFAGLKSQPHESHLVSHRNSEPWHNVQRPLWAWTLPIEHDGFVDLSPGNSIYRRTTLEAVGGFDEMFEQFLDETDLCLRISESTSGILEQVESASTYLSDEFSGWPLIGRMLKNPFGLAKERVYFTLKYADENLEEVKVNRLIRDCKRRLSKLKADAGWAADLGNLTQQQVHSFDGQLGSGAAAGAQLARQPRAPRRTINRLEREKFLPFPTARSRNSKALKEQPPLRIVYVSRTLEPDASVIEHPMLEMARTLADAGHEVHIIHSARAQRLLECRNGVWFHAIEPRPGALPFDWSPDADASPALDDMIAWSAAAHLEVKNLARSRSIDIVCTPSRRLEGLICHLDPGLTSVLWLDGTAKDHIRFEGMTPLGRARLLALETQLITCARSIIGPGQSTLDGLKSEFEGISAKVILPVYPGVADAGDGLETSGMPALVSSTERKTPTSGTPSSFRPASAPKAKRIRILFVGSLDNRRGAPSLIRACAPLLAQFADLELVLCGDDTAKDEFGKTLRERFVDRYSLDPLSDRVFFRGRESAADLAREFEQADIFCLPTRYESYGLEPIEALRRSKPLVARPIGFLNQVLIDGVNCLLAPADDDDALTNCLRQLVENEPLRDQLGKAGRKTYQDNFTIERAAENMLQAYRRIVESRRQP